VLEWELLFGGLQLILCQDYAIAVMLVTCSCHRLETAAILNPVPLPHFQPMPSAESGCHFAI
jgi:hypothetical protein